MTRYGSLIALRDAERDRQHRAKVVVKGEELPWEDNPQGRQKWYMHPDMDENVLKTLLFVCQEISPGHSSGRQRTPGGIVGYVWRGEGFSLVDDVRHDWKAGDVLCFPVRTGGVEIQHFNAGDSLVHLILCEPNLIGALGVDRGWGLEQIMTAGPYEAGAR